MAIGVFLGGIFAYFVREWYSGINEGKQAALIGSESSFGKEYGGVLGKMEGFYYPFFHYQFGVGKIEYGWASDTFKEEQDIEIDSRNVCQ